MKLAIEVARDLKIQSVDRNLAAPITAPQSFYSSTVQIPSRFSARSL